MTTSSQAHADNSNSRNNEEGWKGSKSSQVGRVGALFFVIAVPFVALLVFNGGIRMNQVESFPNERAPTLSDLRELKDALASLHETQEAMMKNTAISLRETQDAMMKKTAVSLRETQEAMVAEFGHQEAKVKAIQSKSKPARNRSSRRNSDYLYDIYDIYDNKSVARNLHPKKPRKLQDDTECDGNVLRVEVYPDFFPTETIWTLTQVETGDLMANVTYADSWDFYFTLQIEEICISPGPYEFELTDQYADGISCEMPGETGCYKIFLDDELLVVGPPFTQSIRTHEFDTSALCVIEMVFRLDFIEDFDVTETVTLKEIGQKDEEIPLIEIEDPLLMNSNYTSSYYSCLRPGIFELNILDSAPFCNETTCYSASVDNEPLLEGDFSSTPFTYDFFINVENNVFERLCAQKPLISPINDFSQFSFNDRVSRVLNVLNSASSLDDIYTRGSSQYKAACYILYDDPTKIIAEDPVLIERYAAAVTVYATNLYAEIEMGINMCQHILFTCDDDDHITEIAIAGGGGIGGSSIPTEIGHLVYLENFIQSERELGGTIPTEVSELKKIVRFNVERNSLSGTIPTEFGSLPALQSLRFWRNNLEGSIPSELGSLSELWFVTMQENFLSGSIPTELMDATNLETLILYQNMLTGPIPTEIGQLANLTIFYSESNDFTGTLPTEIGFIEGLELLDLSFNKLTGTIPVEIGNIPFEVFRVNDNFLTGTLPELAVAGEYYVNNNSITGTIPESLWALNITELKLKDNELKGLVPELYCEQVESIDFKGVYALFVDDSPWFMDDANVPCACCDDVNCLMWENFEVSFIGGTRRPSCPTESIWRTRVYERFIISDLTTNSIYGEGIGAATAEDMEFCISPTGCFNVLEELEDGGANDLELTWDRNLTLGYSELTNKLEEGVCDAVDICGTLIEPDHPKRKGLNHLTHLITPNFYKEDPTSSHYKALCWIITKDEEPLLVDNICDGTFLQRYTMALFFISQDIFFSNEEEMISGFSSISTCNWTGVTCDDTNNKFVEEINLDDQDLQKGIISEIGLLTRLVKFNLNTNNIIGTIDPLIFTHLPHLEIFDVGANLIGGEIPKELLILPELKQVNISNNLLISKVPSNAIYSEKLVSFDIENNLLTGFLPQPLMECIQLESLNLARNNFKGEIPGDIGNLKKLRELKMHKNQLSGSLPLSMFGLTEMEFFFLQANQLTGSIPTNIGLLEKVTEVVLSHNSLKGPIPSEIESLKNLDFLHLQMNTLTGKAPSMPKNMIVTDGFKYITDCGSPNYNLANAITCSDCTHCCNSDEMCQENLERSLPVTDLGWITIFSIPVGLALLGFIVLVVTCNKVKENRDLSDLVDEDSTYCLLFSDKVSAWMVYLLTLAAQFYFYYTYLLASTFTHATSDWQYTVSCPSTNMICNDQSTVNTNGWILFFIVTLSTLGVDFINSGFQILKSVAMKDTWLGLSGVLHFAMTILAIYASFFYNMALATTNTELVSNAVILLFINDLDEQIMSIFVNLFPGWSEACYESLKGNLHKRSNENDDDNDDDEGKEKAEHDDQAELVYP